MMTAIEMTTAIDRCAVRRARHELCQAWRSTLIAKGAIEVTTPILNAYPDIAPVRQFTTTHPTSGRSACLRIAPTEHLKRLLADGEERVFEFSQNFRDDLGDATHLPEFMSLEFMAAGSTCAEMEALATELIGVALAALLPISSSAAPPWARAFMEEGRVRRVSISTLLSERAEQIPVDELDKIVESRAAAVGGVVFMGDFPQALGGPALAHAGLPGFKQRTELFVDGLEIANMSSTLTDSALLRDWHRAGIERKAALGIQPNQPDTDLLQAADQGIPESAVIGIGIERMLQASLGLENISQGSTNQY